jgi:hypothetical protein
VRASLWLLADKFSQGMTMAVMLQGFYWDCVLKEKKQGEWWNYLNAEVPKLGK